MSEVADEIYPMDGRPRTECPEEHITYRTAQLSEFLNKTGKGRRWN